MTERTRKFAMHFEHIDHAIYKDRAVEDLRVELTAFKDLKNVQVTIEYEVLQE